MKVVLFCGGLGTRMREFSETIPKPLVNIGNRPIVWHLMKYYAHHGHKEFILCLGYRGDLLKEYFLNYKEWLSNDFCLRNGGKSVELFTRDIDDWKIAFVDTGLNSNIAQRLVAIKRHLEGEEEFLANYSDALSDLPLPEHIDLFRRKNAIASFVAVRPSQTFHSVAVQEDGLVSNIEHVGQSDIWINGGFFVLRKDIFDYIREGEELVNAPFQRLMAERRLISNKYTGFWAAMDTFKDKKMFDDLNDSGQRPWEVWRSQPKSSR
ncbi:MAG: sugar phosphate nucleotidyltransferase [Burkholderiales bacterium]